MRQEKLLSGTGLEIISYRPDASKGARGVRIHPLHNGMPLARVFLH